MNIKYEEIPKVELHLHLDGSVPLYLLSNYLNQDATSNAIAQDKCQNLADYLTKFDLPISYLKHKKNLKEASYQLSKNLEQDGVIYAEVRYAPNLLLSDELDLNETVKTILEGFSLGNVKINLILCMMRNHSFTENLKIIELAEKYLNKGVCAIDLAGDEEHFPTSNFKELFKIAKDKNIPFTIHSGEVNIKNSLKSALSFGTKRLGHGIQAINYKEILQDIKDKNILLEVCPTSNIQTNVIDTYKNHPIKQLKDQNILISINTDNRTVSNITLSNEYQKLNKYFNFTIKDFCQFNLNAINGSFLSPQEKEDLTNIILNYQKKVSN